MIDKEGRVRWRFVVSITSMIILGSAFTKAEVHPRVALKLRMAVLVVRVLVPINLEFPMSCERVVGCLGLHRAVVLVWRGFGLATL